MKYTFLGIMFFLLAGCFSSEPSESEMEEAFTKSALPYAKKSFSAGAGIFAAGFTQDMTVDIRNFEKISCVELSEKLYSCEIFAEMKIKLPKETGTLLALFGGGEIQEWIQISQAVDFLKLNSGWIVKNPNY
ncbi:hypothetical protein OAL99_00490 [Gammaproteobacteria bacterium]|nr:hypothetical protein [Gammaproteobacteria bacterium]